MPIKKTPIPTFEPEVFSGEKELPNIQGVLRHESYKEKFQRTILDQFEEYPPPEPVTALVQYDEIIPLLTLNSFSLLQGKQKAKKTTFLALLIAAFISDKIIMGHIYFKPMMKGKVLYFDNEQGRSYAARTMKMILRLAGVSISPNLIYCDLRETAPNERLKIIEAGIAATPDVKIVVIDGIVDLMTDFMDASEGHGLVTELIRLCSIYNIHIAGVLHQNKGDKHARAHVGTISSQKCEIEISSEVDTYDLSKSIVTCVNSRGIPFKPFSIQWEKGSLPCICQKLVVKEVQGKQNTSNVIWVKSIIKNIFMPSETLSYKQAIEAIMNETMRSEATAKRFMTNAINWRLIEKGLSGSYAISKSLVSEVQAVSIEVHDPVA